MQQREQGRTSLQSHSTGLYAQDIIKKSRLVFKQEKMGFMGLATQMELQGDIQLAEQSPDSVKNEMI